MWKVCKPSFLYSLGAGIYIVFVALFINHANSLLGSADTVYTSIAALLLFTMSALIVGGLLIGKPIFLYIDGKKKGCHLDAFRQRWLVVALFHYCHNCFNTN